MSVKEDHGDRDFIKRLEEACSKAISEITKVEVATEAGAKLGNWDVGALVSWEVYRSTVVGPGLSHVKRVVDHDGSAELEYIYDQTAIVGLMCHAVKVGSHVKRRKNGASNLYRRNPEGNGWQKVWVRPTGTGIHGIHSDTHTIQKVMTGVVDMIADFYAHFDGRP